MALGNPTQGLADGTCFLWMGSPTRVLGGAEQDVTPPQFTQLQVVAHLCPRAPAFSFLGQMEGPGPRVSRSNGSRGIPLLSWLLSLRSCCCLVAKSCLTLCNPTNYSPPGSSVCGILRARILEWVAISSSRGSSQPRNGTLITFAFFTLYSLGSPIISSYCIYIRWLICI